MHITNLVITSIAALMTGWAAVLNFARAESVKAVADRVQVPQTWMIPLGTLLALGATGLVVGFAVPAVGIAASAGLAAYFVCAVTAHLRVRDTGISGALFFLLLAVASVVSHVADLWS
ncbi:MAG TPA: DoxX family protein [Marmoricola sp.]|nr:DoxX family protein [Marmoricola sp.]